MSLLSFFLPLVFLLYLVALLRAVWRYRSEPPLLPTNGRQYSGYTEPRPSHSHVETRSTVPRSILCSTSNSEVRALPNAVATQPQQCSAKSLPPPLPSRPLSSLASAAQKPRPDPISKYDPPGILVEQPHRPVNKVPQTAQVVVVKPFVKPPEPVYQSGVAPPLPARKPRGCSFSGEGIPGPSVGGVIGTATKALVEESVKPLQPVYQKPQEPLVQKPRQPLPSPGSQDEASITNEDNDEDSDDSIDLQKQGLDHPALRELAKQEWENMKKCRNEERSARRCGQLMRARELAEKSEQHKRCMQILNDQAAEVIFSKKNKNQDPTFRRIDLHGLRVNEAIDHTKRAIKRAHELGNSEMRIIVGKGKHSKDGQAKVKPAILALLQNHYQFSVKIDPSNTGALDVKLDSALSL